MKTFLVVAALFAAPVVAYAGDPPPMPPAASPKKIDPPPMAPVKVPPAIASTVKPKAPCTACGDVCLCQPGSCPGGCPVNASGVVVATKPPAQPAGEYRYAAGYGTFWVPAGSILAYPDGSGRPFPSVVVSGPGAAPSLMMTFPAANSCPSGKCPLQR